MCESAGGVFATSANERRKVTPGKTREISSRCYRFQATRNFREISEQFSSSSDVLNITKAASGRLCMSRVALEFVRSCAVSGLSCWVAPHQKNNFVLHQAEEIMLQQYSCRS